MEEERKVDEREMDEIMEERAAEWEKVVSKLMKEEGQYVSTLTIEEKKAEYAKLLQVSNESAKGVAQLITQRLFLRVVHDCNEETNALEKPAYPIKYENGGFYEWYWQMMFGVFLNRILGCVTVGKLILHVFCVGWGRSADSKTSWWRVDPIQNQRDIDEKAGLIVETICGSRDFKALPDPQTLSTGHHLRVVVWLMECRHLFAVGWDIYTVVDQLKCDIFQLNTLPPSNVVLAIMKELKISLSRIYGLTPSIGIYSAVGVDDVQVSHDFPCVPFVARSTLYTAMCENLMEVNYVSFFPQKFPREIEDEKSLYLKFEDMLLEFVRQKVETPDTLLLVPEKFYSEKILNINDLCFECYDKVTGQSEFFFFHGFQKGFVSEKYGSPERSIVCPVQSLFYPPPSPLPSLILSASILKECREILLDAKEMIRHLRLGV